MLWVKKVYIVGNEGICCGYQMYILWVTKVCVVDIHVCIVGNEGILWVSSFILWVT